MLMRQPQDRSYVLHARSSRLLPSWHGPSQPDDEKAKCQNGALENDRHIRPENCPGISGITVPYLLKSLSANYRNRCSRFSETRIIEAEARLVDPIDMLLQFVITARA